MRSHETRDLLKSTLLVAGCAPYAADHILGHAPRDSYEMQAVLYLEALRREYAKASGMIRIFAGIEGYLGAAGAAGNRRAGKSEDRQARMGAELRMVSGGLAALAGVILMDGGVGKDLPEWALQAIKDLGGDRPGG